MRALLLILCFSLTFPDRSQAANASFKQLSLAGYACSESDDFDIWGNQYTQEPDPCLPYIKYLISFRSTVRCYARTAQDENLKKTFERILLMIERAIVELGIEKDGLCGLIPGTMFVTPQKEDAVPAVLEELIYALSCIHHIAHVEDNAKLQVYLEEQSVEFVLCLFSIIEPALRVLHQYLTSQDKSLELTQREYQNIDFKNVFGNIELQLLLQLNFAREGQREDPVSLLPPFNLMGSDLTSFSRLALQTKIWLAHQLLFLLEAMEASADAKHAMAGPSDQLRLSNIKATILTWKKYVHQEVLCTPQI